MYRSIKIEHFRCFPSVAIDGLRRVNLIVGRNNAGKSSLLEAIFLLCGATSPIFSLRVGQLRGQRTNGEPPDAIWRALFHDFDISRPIELLGAWEHESVSRSLTIEAKPFGAYSDFTTQAELAGGVARATQELPIGQLRYCYRDASGDEKETTAIYAGSQHPIHAPSALRADFVPTTFLTARSFAALAEPAERFSQLVKAKQETEVVESLRIIDPSLRRLEIVSEAGLPTVYADVGLDRLIPLAVCGEGIVRLFSIAVELAASPNGVLLIDELDNGLHHSVLNHVWRALSNAAARHRVQVFATTHNDELIHSAINAFEGDLGSLGLFRIDKGVEAHRVAHYDDEMMEAVRDEHFEVRG